MEITQFDLSSTFGMSEYERLAADIINFINDPNKPKGNFLLEGYGRGEKWETQFSIKEVTNDPDLFAMFCASGFLCNSYFPKGFFRVSDEFRKRVESKNLIK